MSKHQVSELIVIASLIRLSHLLFYSQTLEGKSDTGGCGETAGGRGRWARGRRKKKMHTTPLIFKNTYIIHKAWFLQGATTTHGYFQHEQPTQTAHWQLYLKQLNLKTKHNSARLRISIDDVIKSKCKEEDENGWKREQGVKEKCLF